MKSSANLTRVTEKGQATIPLHIRSHLKLSHGDYVAYEIDSVGRVVLAKVRIGVEPPDIDRKESPTKNRK